MKERVGIFGEGKREKNFFSIVTQRKKTKAKSKSRSYPKPHTSAHSPSNLSLEQR